MMRRLACQISVFGLGFVAAMLVIVPGIRMLNASRNNGSTKLVTLVMGENHVTSCGVNAYAFAIDRLHLENDANISVSLQHQADRNLGFLDINDIANALRSAGARADVKNIEEIDTFCRNLDPNAVGIFHVDPEYGGHFVSVRRLPSTDSSQYESLDKDNQVEVLDEKTLCEKIKKRTSGWVILASRGSTFNNLCTAFSLFLSGTQNIRYSNPVLQAANHKSNDHVQSMQTHLHGMVLASDVIEQSCDSKAKQIVVPVQLSNQSGQDIRILSAKGSCQCFSGLQQTLPLVLHAHETLELGAKFAVDMTFLSKRNLSMAIEISQTPQSVIPVSISLVNASDSFPFIVTPNKMAGIVEPGKPVSADFMFLVEGRDDAKIKVKDCRVVEGNGSVNVGEPFKEILGGHAFVARPIHVTLSNASSGLNLLRAQVTLDSGQISEVSLRAYGNEL